MPYISIMLENPSGFKAIKIIAIKLIFCSLAFSLFGQEQLGIRGSHFGGVHSLMLNPASGFNYHKRSDLNIIGLGVFASNNYAYVEDFSVLKLVGNNGDFVSRPEASALDGPSTAYVDFFSGKNNYWVSSHAEITLPSLLYILNEKWAFGLINRLRVYGSSFDIPKNAGYYDYSPIDIDNPIIMDPTSFIAAAWAEIGANAAYSWPTSGGYMNIGASIKYLAGLESFLFRSNDELNITKRSSNSNLIEIQELDIEVGYASSLIEDGSISQRGQGWAADIGFEISMDSDDPKRKFDYRLGASILDIGRINYNQGVNYHQFFKTSPSELELDSLRTFSDVTLIDDAIQFLESELLNGAVSRVDKDIAIYTPAAVSIYLDKSLGKNWYLNTLFIQRLSFHDNVLKRASQLAFLPRYEGKSVGVSLPVTLLEWERIRVGLSGRVGILYFGTEDIAGLAFGKSKLDGADFYLALKFSPFTWNKKSPKVKQDKTKKSRVKCPD